MKVYEGIDLDIKHNYKHFSVEHRHGTNWSIYDKRGGYLGDIIWYKRWKQYCLESGEAIWSLSCLDDVKDFIQKLNKFVRWCDFCGHISTKRRKVFEHPRQKNKHVCEYCLEKESITSEDLSIMAKKEKIFKGEANV